MMLVRTSMWKKCSGTPQLEKMRWYCQLEKMHWYCQVYRFQITEKHIDSIKWKNALVLSNTILLGLFRFLNFIGLFVAGHQNGWGLSHAKCVLLRWGGYSHATISYMNRYIWCAGVLYLGLANLS